MNRRILVGALLLSLLNFGAGKKDDSYVERWNSEASYPPNVRYVPPTELSGPPQLKIEGFDQPTTTTVATIENPRIRTSEYQLSGEISYKGVQGTGHLEMWSYFADGNAYFTKAIDASGLMQALSGDSNGRRFALPFHSQKGTFPTKIVVNVVLPGKGTVMLSPLTLAPIVTSSEWWSASTGGWIGGIVGTVLGCLGGLIGMLASRGRAPRFVQAAMVGMIVVGVAFLVAAAFALIARQPWAVYYPLLLCGGLIVLVIPIQLPSIKRRYAEIELRRMTAMDMPG